MLTGGLNRSSMIAEVASRANFNSATQSPKAKAELARRKFASGQRKQTGGKLWIISTNDNSIGL